MPTASSPPVVVTGGAGYIGSHPCDALMVRERAARCVDSLVGTGNSTRNVERALVRVAIASLDQRRAG